MYSDYKIPTGIVQFMYTNGVVDSSALYVDNKDSIDHLSNLNKIKDWIDDNMDNTMNNCNIYLDLLKIIDLFEQINTPKILTFVETKTI